MPHAFRAVGYACLGCGISSIQDRALCENYVKVECVSQRPDEASLVERNGGLSTSLQIDLISHCPGVYNFCCSCEDFASVGALTKRQVRACSFLRAYVRSGLPTTLWGPHAFLASCASESTPLFACLRSCVRACVHSCSLARACEFREGACREATPRQPLR